MNISKTLFKNLTRCENFASLYDIYTLRSCHHITKILPDQLLSAEQDIDKMESGFFDDDSDKAKEILNNMFDEETGDDLLNIESAQLEALKKYFSKLEAVAARVIEKKFPGKITKGAITKDQKKFSFSKNNNEYYCYLDIYDECDDGTIRIFEVKATTNKKFYELGTKNKDLVERKKQSFNNDITNEALCNSIFVRKDDILYLKEIFDQSVLQNKKYLENRNKLFIKYSSNGSGKYVYDIAIERYIVENSLIQQNKQDLIPNIKYYLAVLNSDYVLPCDEITDFETLDYPTDNNGNNLISFIDLTLITDEYKDIIKNEIDFIENSINSCEITKSCLGEHCEYKKPSSCLFLPICLKKAKVDGSILEFFGNNLVYDDEKISYFDAINDKYYKITDIDSDFKLTPKQSVQYDCLVQNKEYINEELVKIHIDKIKYPIYHLDFESFNAPIPRFRGEKPYMQSVFQFSLHIEKEPGVCDKDKDHVEFLASDEKDHRKELCEALIKNIDLSNGGVVLVYNESFEKTRLKELAIIFPEYKEQLIKIRDAIVDLMDVVKGGPTATARALGVDKKVVEAKCAMYNYYNNNLHGSYSIKKVLPIFTNLTYSTLTVKNGTEAVLAYSRLPEFSDSEREKYYYALKEYCKQDTWAMVEILKGFRKLV